MKTHQTHNLEEKGQTDSFHKLGRLKMPKDLAGKSVLDIGCNEGFFCYQASLRHAEKVLGIDQNANCISEATTRYGSESVSFLKSDWNNLPAGPFDLVLWTSAMHYELDPATVLENISRRLSPGALLILECGVLHNPQKLMSYVVRHDGGLWYPTLEFLETAIAKAKMSYRMVSNAELTGADPVPRVVYHCSPRIPTVVLITGRSQDGKSNLAALLRQSCTKLISLDQFVARISSANWAFSPLEQFIKQRIDPANLLSVYHGIDEHALTNDYTELLSKGVSASDELVVIEGYMTPKQVEALTSCLSGRARVWEASRR